MRENSLAQRNMSEVEDSRERSACTVKCKVSDMAQSQSTSFARHRRENRRYPVESNFCFFLFSFFPLLSLSLSLSLTVVSFSPFESVAIANYFARNRLETKKPLPQGAPSRCFARFRNINYALPVKLYTCTARRRQ